MSAKAWLKLLVAVALILGIAFRCINLDRKIFWVDEVATALRIAGNTKASVTAALMQQPQISVAQLQQYQQPSLDRNWRDTITALTQSPEHAPLYFLLASAWTQAFGSSIAALRSLSVVFSLLTLPVLYALCDELFAAPVAGPLAIALFAVSPFHVAYAQEARPYSLWTLAIALSSLTLLRAVRLKTVWGWSLYAASLVIGLYTSLLTLLVAIGHSLYVGILSQFRPTQLTKAFGLAIALSTVAFLPWLAVILQQFQQLQANTTWMREPMALPAMVAVWLYTIVILFVDFPVYLPVDPVIIGAILCDLVLLAIVGVAVYRSARTPPRSRFFLLTLLLTTPIVLILIDLLLGQQASTAPRYMIPAHLGIQLAVAYCFSQTIFAQPGWRVALLLVLSLGVASGVANLDRSPRYQKTRNLHNPSIAAIVNAAPRPIVLAEPEAVIDMLSLSHNLDPDVVVELRSPADFPQTLQDCRQRFLFNPTPTLLADLQQQPVQLTPLYQPQLLIPGEISLSLWTVRSMVGNCSPLL